jgi:hypothetical protein
VVSVSTVSTVIKFTVPLTVTVPCSPLSSTALPPP